MVNAGSSSLRLDVLDAASGARRARARAERLGTPEARVRLDDGAEEPLLDAGGRAGELLRRIFPLQGLWYGLNYV